MKFLSLLLLAATSTAWAYIPEYSTIASRAAEQHGRGIFRIEQDVTYRHESESFTVKETWTVINENDLRLTIEGRGPLKGLVQGTFIYDGSLRSYIDGSQTVRSSRLGDDWLEPLLHFRSSKYFRSRLVNLKVVPSETLRDRAPLNFEGPPMYEPATFIRLSRVGGGVSWAIGLPPTLGTSPTIWLEQDQFVPRKFRSASGVVMKADGYAKYEDGLWYPRSITYNFGQYTVQINTLSVKYLGQKLPAGDTRFKTASLSTQDIVKLPESGGLREFYSRFR